MSFTSAYIYIYILLLLLLLLLFTPLEFFTSVLADFFSLEFEWQQVSSSLQNSSQYSVLDNVVIWMVSTCPLISKSYSTFNNSVPKVPITIGTIVTCMFHSFFQFPIKAHVLILLFTFVQFYSVVSRDSKVHNFASSLFLLLLIIIRSSDTGIMVRVFVWTERPGFNPRSSHTKD